MSVFKRIKEVLILGKIPPPVGGVTVHVHRLLANLHCRNYNSFHFHDLGKESVWKLILKIPRYEVLHLHTSNVYFQLIVAIYCRMVSSRLIITYHGNWDRYGLIKNYSVRISSWLAYIPLVQNPESMVKVQRWNKSAILLSAYIPPLEIIPLDSQILQNVLELKIKYKYLFCTNASNLTFDKNGCEIYGISSLIENISKSGKCALIISDPSGNYQSYIGKVLDNILFITRPHYFLNILKLSDAFIRNTTTDGDSISIHEATACQVLVFATSCVSRPQECVLYKDVGNMDFVSGLQRVKLNKEKQIKQDYFDTTGKVIELYNMCLS